MGKILDETAITAVYKANNKNDAVAAHEKHGVKEHIGTSLTETDAFDKPSLAFGYSLPDVFRP